MFSKSFLGLAALGLACAAHAGPYAPAAGQAGSTAISLSSPSITHWATGYRHYQPGPNVSDSFKTPQLALGAATGAAADVVVLGDGGSITLSFGGYITNGAGADFAVFENSFSDTFLELAWVEVSSDGLNFFRFPGYSFTPSPVGGFGSVDPTNVDGLAGKYRAGWGTPFDLAQLSGRDGLDVDRVQYVRIVDIKGDGSVFDSYPAGAPFFGPHPIYDPYPTSLSGGFDLEAVGVMHFAAQVPEPHTWLSLMLGLLALAALGRRRALWLTGGLALAGAAQASVVSGFEEGPLAPQSHYFPIAEAQFTSGAARFSHHYTDYGFPGCCWDGWTYSNRTDISTPGLESQFSVYSASGAASGSTGSGQGGSAQYGIAYLGAAELDFAGASVVQSGWFANTTYAALSMRDGDGFGKKFGGASGNDADWFKLTISGIDAFGQTVSSLDVYLADFRFDDAARDYILDDWSFVDLSGLGVVSGLRFALSSSDNGAFGMNTPAYFALDNLSVAAVPEPATSWALLAGLAALAARARLARLAAPRAARV